MRQTLRDYGYKLTKVPLLCDNESAIRMADNPIEHSRTKHIAIRYHFLTDHQQRGDIEIAYINTKEQLADIFIKPLDEKTFTKLRHELNILDSRSAFRDRGVPKPTSECRRVPQPRWVDARPSAKGGSEVAGDRRERGGNPAAFVFVPRPGRVRLQ
jgi:hypothetical protein